MKNILVVDDEEIIRENLFRILTEEQYAVSTVATGKEGLDFIRQNEVDVVLLDLNLPDIHGIEVLKKARDLDPELLVIVITGYASIESAVDALKLGAYDYIKKPFKADAIKLILRLAMETRQLKKQVGVLKKSLNLPDKTDVVAQSAQMKSILTQAREVARHEGANVLITGESGTGKEVVAQAIHQASPRRDMPLVIINCAALPGNLLESELFGHEKGAFTDAVKQNKGFFEMAQGGTVFLDEIGEMPVQLQAKLLGVLERKNFRRIGGRRDIQTDVKMIAATNIDFKQAIAEKKFREDLYYRLSVFPIHIPPLRERPEDIVALAKIFLNKFTKQFHKKFQDMDADAKEKLMQYRWPGNVRELRNVFERICIMHNETALKRSHLPPEIENAVNKIPSDSDAFLEIPKDLYDIESVLEEVTARLITRALKKCRGNTTKAAKLLGIPRGTLRYKISKLKIM
ncbi:sigma-54-dependent transcriptional regulator [Desulfobacula phenolica]|uniref:DNA-binding transcriptional response regulator, NtrC family, contains REC, AAA-type ATPase, and a Fis-type DNA-binding domains n=1 Tax=Desulfobacula phenolica TaxID=90732 RepID=A0A1H2HZY0_9BACT|nr:sigma-54 dependent transcriptional regulator [Desulfobacula phenolica]SDU37393.1 DNA-binding transcriptional response regulator, NtrC family, contains REC, AAA-type ATPase, and a Fis-type DNA-binding domains [Desulfobacula phenolica]